MNQEVVKDFIEVHSDILNEGTIKKMEDCGTVDECYAILNPLGCLLSGDETIFDIDRQCFVEADFEVPEYVHWRYEHIDVNFPDGYFTYAFDRDTFLNLEKELGVKIRVRTPNQHFFVIENGVLSGITQTKGTHLQ